MLADAHCIGTLAVEDSQVGVTASEALSMTSRGLGDEVLWGTAVF